MEDLEEDESDIEDAAEWGGSYWGAPGSKDAGGRRSGGGDSDSEEDDGDDDGEAISLVVFLNCQGIGRNGFCLDETCASPLLLIGWSVD